MGGAGGFVGGYLQFSRHSCVLWGWLRVFLRACMRAGEIVGGVEGGGGVFHGW